MVKDIQSVLFCCDYNAVRSPMAEGICKKMYGKSIFIQSVGVYHDIEIDGFAISVCEEIGVILERHRARSFSEMEEWGDDISGFDLIVALSPASQRLALEYTRYFSLNIEYWPTLDPTNIGETREAKLQSYRLTRDQIMGRIRNRFVVDK